ncbi:hypothetical protein AB0K60_11945 [Thermopolyspora sp. NPDC052614]
MLDNLSKVKSRPTRRITLLEEHRQALITAAVIGAFDMSNASGQGIDVS